MNEETKKLAKYILTEIALSKKFAQTPQSHDMFISSENIQAALAGLVSPLVNLESSYRKKLKLYVETVDSDGKAMSIAKAEILAKAGHHASSCRNSCFCRVHDSLGRYCTLFRV